MRTAKTLIWLGGCPDWSESALGAKVILLALSGGGSYVYHWCHLPGCHIATTSLLSSYLHLNILGTAGGLLPELTPTLTPPIPFFNRVGITAALIPKLKKKRLLTVTFLKFEQCKPAHDETNEMICAPSEDSTQFDQKLHFPPEGSLDP